MPDKHKMINSNNSDALLKVSDHNKLVQLLFVNHMSNLTKFYCIVLSISFARQYRYERFYWP